MLLVSSSVLQPTLHATASLFFPIHFLSIFVVEITCLLLFVYSWNSPWKISAEIRCTYPEPRQVGTVEIAYVSDPRVKYIGGSEEDVFSPDEDPSRAFLSQEIELLSIVAERIGNLLTRNAVELKIARLTDKLALCTECHCVRDSDGMWKTLQVFLEEHSNVTFNNILCPGCAEHLLACSKSSSTNTPEKSVTSST